MKLIPMEDFVLQKSDEIENHRKSKNLQVKMNPSLLSKENYGIDYWVNQKFKEIISYANFLKTPMRYEHFHGRAAVVKIKGVSVLNPVNGKTGKIMESVGLIFSPDDDNDEWRFTFSVSNDRTFAALVHQPGVELTEEGVKLIFG